MKPTMRVLNHDRKPENGRRPFDLAFADHLMGDVSTQMASCPTIPASFDHAMPCVAVGTARNLWNTQAASDAVRAQTGRGGNEEVVDLQVIP